MALGLRHITERAGDDAGHPFLDDENGEELMHVQPEVAIVLGNTAPQSPGTLYISSKQVVWLSDVDRRKGYAVDFLSISLHAISRDPEAYPFPCIYTQIETECLSSEDEDSGGSESDYDENLELSKITEMRLVPSDPNQLDTLFSVFCVCAELNPEPDGEHDAEDNWVFGNDSLGGELGEDSDWHFSEDFSNPIGYSNGVKDHDLAHAVLELQIDDQRFKDAEDTEHESGGSHTDQRSVKLLRSRRNLKTEKFLQQGQNGLMRKPHQVQIKSLRRNYIQKMLSTKIRLVGMMMNIFSRHRPRWKGAWNVSWSM